MKIEKKQSIREQLLEINYGKVVMIPKTSDRQLQLIREVASKLNNEGKIVHENGTIYRPNGFFKISCPKNELMNKVNKHAGFIIFILRTKV